MIPLLSYSKVVLESRLKLGRSLTAPNTTQLTNPMKRGQRVHQLINDYKDYYAIAVDIHI
jgi:hypothetical protein